MSKRADLVKKAYNVHFTDLQTMAEKLDLLRSIVEDTQHMEGDDALIEKINTYINDLEENLEHSARNLEKHGTSLFDKIG